MLKAFVLFTLRGRMKQGINVLRKARLMRLQRCSARILRLTQAARELVCS
jgi:hypothetical protein